ncbi:MAG: DsbA family protein [Anaerolineae bacterium]|nr:DsbA family protein [Gloeobacterales cyanobacterium ES-bin-313]
MQKPLLFLSACLLSLNLSPVYGQALSAEEKAEIKKYVATYVKKPISVNLAKAPIQGNTKADLTLIEFSDFQCPFCRESQATLEALRIKYGKRLRIAFINFPLSMHPQAKNAALAAWAAGQQGHFWEYHDRLFARQEKLGDELYVELAKALKLDLAKFNQDRASDQAAKAIEADKAQATKAGVNGTPTFVLNGIPMVNPPANLVEQVVVAWEKRGK